VRWGNTRPFCEYVHVGGFVAGVQPGVRLLEGGHGRARGGRGVGGGTERALPVLGGLCMYICYTTGVLIRGSEKEMDEKKEWKGG
jgi:hypothetical protein